MYCDQFQIRLIKSGSTNQPLSIIIIGGWWNGTVNIKTFYRSRVLIFMSKYITNTLSTHNILLGIIDFFFKKAKQGIFIDLRKRMTEEKLCLETIIDFDNIC